jgi:hypothetical protein
VYSELKSHATIRLFQCCSSFSNSLWKTLHFRHFITFLLLSNAEFVLNLMIGYPADILGPCKNRKAHSCAQLYTEPTRGIERRTHLQEKYFASAH